MVVNCISESNVGSFACVGCLFWLLRPGTQCFLLTLSIFHEGSKILSGGNCTLCTGFQRVCIGLLIKDSFVVCCDDLVYVEHAAAA